MGNDRAFLKRFFPPAMLTGAIFLGVPAVGRPAEAVPAAQPVSRSDIVLGAFEGSSLEGWTRTGSAFAPTPYRPGADGRFTGLSGKGLAWSGAEGPEPTGTLLSPTFFIERPFIGFLVAGERHRETRSTCIGFSSGSSAQHCQRFRPSSQLEQEAVTVPAFSSFSLGLLSLLWSPTSSPGNTEGPPNVVLIMTDDQGYGDIRSHGNELIDTPVLDRLAANGVRFDRFYVSPVCAPTRASLLTGRDHLATGTSWVTHRGEVMRSEEVTIAEILKDAGYATGCFGKWHNGAQYPNHPNGQGFDEFFGFCGGAWNLYFDAPLERNGTQVKTKGYITDVLTDAALAFIEKHRRRPFFCYLPYNAPHSPYVVPDRYFDKYKARGLDDKNAAVYGMVECLDDNIGRLLTRLDELQLSDRTIVLFLTDNGPNGKRFNANMRGTKGSVHEGGVRVPLFVRWKGHLPAGLTVRPIAQHIDLLPTIVELCGLPMPKTLPLAGKSLVPLMKDNAAGWPDRMLFTHQSRRGDVEITPGAVRTQQYRLVRYGKSYELYDMLADPSQAHDIAARQPDLVGRLASAYERWFAGVSERGFERPPIPAGYPQVDEVIVPPSAALLIGKVHFANSIGWTTDWITGWQGTEDRIIWELDVAQPTRYEVQLRYSCSKENTGAVLCLTAGDQQLRARVDRAYDKGRTPRPDRVPGKPWWLREFTTLRLGRLLLPKGRVQIQLRSATIPGQQAPDIGGLRLHRVE